jgi:NADPH:quinone reductase
MRALVVSDYTSVDSLRLQDAASPMVARGHVRVRVKAAGIGFVDALKIAGRYQTKDPLPFVPGMEFSGIVDEVGDDVTASPSRSAQKARKCSYIVATSPTEPFSLPA